MSGREVNFYHDLSSSTFRVARSGILPPDRLCDVAFGLRQSMRRARLYDEWHPFAAVHFYLCPGPSLRRYYEQDPAKEKAGLLVASAGEQAFSLEQV